MTTQPQAEPLETGELLSLVVDKGLDVTFHVAGPIVGIILVVLLLLVFAALFRGGIISKLSKYELDAAEFGMRGQKIVLRPNDTDKQIAYKIWVELSTRKIGLEIEPDDDVIYDIYKSWYDFFGVTRELIKDVPATKFRRRNTEKIIRLSIEVLNQGIRPHLTKWQARFRYWYEKQLEKDKEGELSPQEIQTKFPQYDELCADLLDVNQRLIKYRKRMYEIVTGDRD